MSDQLEKEKEYALNLLYLRSNHERQSFRIMYVESAEDGKLCGERNRSLIPIALEELASQSKKQIELVKTLLQQLKKL